MSEHTHYDNPKFADHLTKLDRKSSVNDLLEFMGSSNGWQGNDLKKLLDEVYSIRGKVNFDVSTGHESLQSDHPKQSSH